MGGVGVFLRWFISVAVLGLLIASKIIAGAFITKFYRFNNRIAGTDLEGDSEPMVRMMTKSTTFVSRGIWRRRRKVWIRSRTAFAFISQHQSAMDTTKGSASRCIGDVTTAFPNGTAIDGAIDRRARWAKAKRRTRKRSRSSSRRDPKRRLRSPLSCRSRWCQKQKKKRWNRKKRKRKQRKTRWRRCAE